MSALRLLGHRVVLEPMKRQASDTGKILYDMSRMDDKTQWRVLQRGPKVAPEIQPGAHVLMPAVFEAQHEFTDGIIISDSRLIHAIVTYDGHKDVSSV